MEAFPVIIKHINGDLYEFVKKNDTTYTVSLLSKYDGMPVGKEHELPIVNFTEPKP